MIRRRKAIERSGLQPPTEEQVRAWRNKPRKRIPKIGPKTKREKPALDAFREALRERSGGECEGPWFGYVMVGGQSRLVFVPHSTPYRRRREPHYGCDPHHLWPEDRDAGIHDPDRGMWLCRPAHDWVDAFPAQAHQLGMLRPDDGT